MTPTDTQQVSDTHRRPHKGKSRAGAIKKASKNLRWHTIRRWLFLILCVYVIAIVCGALEIVQDGVTKPTDKFELIFLFLVAGPILLCLQGIIEWGAEAGLHALLRLFRRHKK